YPHDDARRLERRYVAEEPVRLPWRPLQRLEDRTGLDELAQERALPGRSLDGRQQREQRCLVARSARFLDGLAERPMLHLRVRRQSRGVRRQEREGMLRIALVLGEVEADATDEVPNRILILHELLNGPLPAAQLEAGRFFDPIP